MKRKKKNKRKLNYNLRHDDKMVFNCIYKLSVCLFSLLFDQYRGNSTWFFSFQSFLFIFLFCYWSIMGSDLLFWFNLLLFAKEKSITGNGQHENWGEWCEIGRTKSNVSIFKEKTINGNCAFLYFPHFANIEKIQFSLSLIAKNIFSIHFVQFKLFKLIFALLESLFTKATVTLFNFQFICLWLLATLLLVFPFHSLSIFSFYFTFFVSLWSPLIFIAKICQMEDCLPENGEFKNISRTNDTANHFQWNFCRQFPSLAKTFKLSFRFYRTKFPIFWKCFQQNSMTMMKYWLKIYE